MHLAGMQRETSLVFWPPWGHNNGLYSDFQAVTKLAATRCVSYTLLCCWTVVLVLFVSSLDKAGKSTVQNG